MVELIEFSLVLMKRIVQIHSDSDDAAAYTESILVFNLVVAFYYKQLGCLDKQTLLPPSARLVAALPLCRSAAASVGCCAFARQQCPHLWDTFITNSCPISNTRGTHAKPQKVIKNARPPPRNEKCQHLRGKAGKPEQ